MRLVKRCLQVHPDGRVQGFRALIPHHRQKSYERKSHIALRYHDRSGAAGAFTALLRAYPSLAETIDREVLKLGKRGTIYQSRIPLKNLHKKFLDKCRELNLEIRGEYPFNVKRLAYSSLATYVKNLINANPHQAAKSIFGKDVVNKLKTSDGENRPVLRPFERVECDAHKIDAIFCILVPSFFGELVPKIVHRLWVVLIVEVVSRAVLGYHLSLRQECDSGDVLHAVKTALSKWEKRDLSFSTISYNDSANFPSTYNDCYTGACWDEFSVDGALANLSVRVDSKLKSVVGSSLLVLNRRLSDDRPFVERFFLTLEEGGFHRLPNTTGHNTDDPRRSNPELAACKYFIQIEHLEDLLDVLVANYNGTPHSSLGYRTPLEYLDYVTKSNEVTLRIADPVDVSRIHHIRKKVTVKGGLEHGRRPYVTYHQVAYTSEILKRSYGLVGKKIIIEIDTNDLRTVRAFTIDGAELGVLRAKPPWNLTPHSLLIRQTINSLVSRKVIHYTQTEDPIVVFLEHVENSVRQRKQVPPAYLDIRRVLVRHRNEFSDEADMHSQIPLSGSANETQPQANSEKKRVVKDKSNPQFKSRKGING